MDLKVLLTYRPYFILYKCIQNHTIKGSYLLSREIFDGCVLNLYICWWTFRCLSECDREMRFIVIISGDLWNTVRNTKLCILFCKVLNSQTFTPFLPFSWYNLLKLLLKSPLYIALETIGPNQGNNYFFTVKASNRVTLSSQDRVLLLDAAQSPCFMNLKYSEEKRWETRTIKSKFKLYLWDFLKFCFSKYECCK